MRRLVFILDLAPLMGKGRGPALRQLATAIARTWAVYHRPDLAWGYALYDSSLGDFLLRAKLRKTAGSLRLGPAFHDISSSSDLKGGDLPDFLRLLDSLSDGQFQERLQSSKDKLVQLQRPDRQEQAGKTGAPVRALVSALQAALGSSFLRKLKEVAEHSSGSDSSSTEGLILLFTPAVTTRATLLSFVGIDAQPSVAGVLDAAAVQELLSKELPLALLQRCREALCRLVWAAAEPPGPPASATAPAATMEAAAATARHAEPEGLARRTRSSNSARQRSGEETAAVEATAQQDDPAPMDPAATKRAVLAGLRAVLNQGLPLGSGPSSAAYELTQLVDAGLLWEPFAALLGLAQQVQREVVQAPAAAAATATAAAPGEGGEQGKGVLHEDVWPGDEESFEEVSSTLAMLLAHLSASTAGGGRAGSDDIRRAVRQRLRQQQRAARQAAKPGGGAGGGGGAGALRRVGLAMPRAKGQAAVQSALEQARRQQVEKENRRTGLGGSQPSTAPSSTVGGPSQGALGSAQQQQPDDEVQSIPALPLDEAAQDLARKLEAYLESLAAQDGEFDSTSWTASMASHLKSLVDLAFAAVRKYGQQDGQEQLASEHIRQRLLSKVAAPAAVVQVEHRALPPNRGQRNLEHLRFERKCVAQMLLRLHICGAGMGNGQELPEGQQVELEGLMGQVMATLHPIPRGGQDFFNSVIRAHFGAKFPGPLLRLAQSSWDEDMELDFDLLMKQHVAKAEEVEASGETPGTTQLPQQQPSGSAAAAGTASGNPQRSGSMRTNDTSGGVRAGPSNLGRPPVAMPLEVHMREVVTSTRPSLAQGASGSASKFSGDNSGVHTGGGSGSGGWGASSKTATSKPLGSQHQLRMRALALGQNNTWQFVAQRQDKKKLAVRAPPGRPRAAGAAPQHVPSRGAAQVAKARQQQAACKGGSQGGSQPKPSHQNVPDTPESHAKQHPKLPSLRLHLLQHTAQQQPQADDAITSPQAIFSPPVQQQQLRQGGAAREEGVVPATDPKLPLLDPLEQLLPVGPLQRAPSSRQLQFAGPPAMAAGGAPGVIPSAAPVESPTSELARGDGGSATVSPVLPMGPTWMVAATQKAPVGLRRFISSANVGQVLPQRQQQQQEEQQQPPPSVLATQQLCNPEPLAFPQGLLPEGEALGTPFSPQDAEAIEDELPPCSEGMLAPSQQEAAMEVDVPGPSPAGTPEAAPAAEVAAAPECIPASPAFAGRVVEVQQAAEVDFAAAVTAATATVAGEPQPIASQPDQPEPSMAGAAQQPAAAAAPALAPAPASAAPATRCKWASGWAPQLGARIRFPFFGSGSPNGRLQAGQPPICKEGTVVGKVLGEDFCYKTYEVLVDGEEQPRELRLERDMRKVEQRQLRYPEEWMLLQDGPSSAGASKAAEQAQHAQGGVQQEGLPASLHATGGAAGGEGPGEEPQEAPHARKGRKAAKQASAGKGQKRQREAAAGEEGQPGEQQQEQPAEDGTVPPPLKRMTRHTAAASQQQHGASPRASPTVAKAAGSGQVVPSSTLVTRQRAYSRTTSQQPSVQQQQQPVMATAASGSPEAVAEGRCLVPPSTQRTTRAKAAAAAAADSPVATGDSDSALPPSTQRTTRSKAVQQLAAAIAATGTPEAAARGGCSPPPPSTKCTILSKAAALKLGLGSPASAGAGLPFVQRELPHGGKAGPTPASRPRARAAVSQGVGKEEEGGEEEQWGRKRLAHRPEDCHDKLSPAGSPSRRLTRSATAATRSLWGGEEEPGEAQDQPMVDAHPPDAYGELAGRVAPFSAPRQSARNTQVAAAHPPDVCGDKVGLPAPFSAPRRSARFTPAAATHPPDARGDKVGLPAPRRSARTTPAAAAHPPDVKCDKVASGEEAAPVSKVEKAQPVVGTRQRRQQQQQEQQERGPGERERWEQGQHAEEPATAKRPTRAAAAARQQDQPQQQQSQQQEGQEEPNSPMPAEELATQQGDAQVKNREEIIGRRVEIQRGGSTFSGTVVGYKHGRHQVRRGGGDLHWHYLFKERFSFVEGEATAAPPNTGEQGVNAAQQEEEVAVEGAEAEGEQAAAATKAAETPAAQMPSEHTRGTATRRTTREVAAAGAAVAVTSAPTATVVTTRRSTRQPAGGEPTPAGSTGTEGARAQSVGPAVAAAAAAAAAAAVKPLATPFSALLQLSCASCAKGRPECASCQAMAAEALRSNGLGFLLGVNKCKASCGGMPNCSNCWAKVTFMLEHPTVAASMRHCTADKAFNAFCLGCREGAKKAQEQHGAVLAGCPKCRYSGLGCPKVCLPKVLSMLEQLESHPLATQGAPTSQAGQQQEPAAAVAGPSAAVGAAVPAPRPKAKARQAGGKRSRAASPEASQQQAGEAATTPAEPVGRVPASSEGMPAGEGAPVGREQAAMPAEDAAAAAPLEGLPRQAPPAEQPAKRSRPTAGQQASAGSSESGASDAAAAELGEVMQQQQQEEGEVQQLAAQAEAQQGVEPGLSQPASGTAIPQPSQRQQQQQQAAGVEQGVEEAAEPAAKKQRMQAGSPVKTHITLRTQLTSTTRTPRKKGLLAAMRSGQSKGNDGEVNQRPRPTSFSRATDQLAGTPRRAPAASAPASPAAPSYNSPAAQLARQSAVAAAAAVPSPYSGAYGPPGPDSPAGSVGGSVAEAPGPASAREAVLAASGAGADVGAAPVEAIGQEEQALQQGQGPKDEVALQAAETETAGAAKGLELGPQAAAVAGPLEAEGAAEELALPAEVSEEEGDQAAMVEANPAAEGPSPTAGMEAASVAADESSPPPNAAPAPAAEPLAVVEAAAAGPAPASLEPVGEEGLASEQSTPSMEAGPPAPTSAGPAGAAATAVVLPQLSPVESEHPASAAPSSAAAGASALPQLSPLEGVCPAAVPAAADETGPSQQAQQQAKPARRLTEKQVAAGAELAGDNVASKESSPRGPNANSAAAEDDHTPPSAKRAPPLQPPPASCEHLQHTALQADRRLSTESAQLLPMSVQHALAAAAQLEEQEVHLTPRALLFSEAVPAPTDPGSRWQQGQSHHLTPCGSAPAVYAALAPAAIMAAAAAGGLLPGQGEGAPLSFHPAMGLASLKAHLQAQQEEEGVECSEGLERVGQVGHALAAAEAPPRPASSPPKLAALGGALTPVKYCTAPAKASQDLAAKLYQSQPTDALAPLPPNMELHTSQKEELGGQVLRCKPVPQASLGLPAAPELLSLAGLGTAPAAGGSGRGCEFPVRGHRVRHMYKGPKSSPSRGPECRLLLVLGENTVSQAASFRSFRALQMDEQGEQVVGVEDKLVLQPASFKARPDLLAKTGDWALDGFERATQVDRLEAKYCQPTPPQQPKMASEFQSILEEMLAVKGDI